MAQARRNQILRRLKKFASSYAKSRLGLIGLFILLGFLTITLAAPLLTPYDPSADRGLASPDLPPTWLEQLDGKPFAPFMLVPPHYHYDNPSDKDQWSLSANQSTPITLQYSASEGYIPPTEGDHKPGALALVFNRTAINTTYPLAVAKLSSQFNWPPGATPSTFDLEFNFKAEIAGNAGFSLAFLASNPDGQTFRLFNSSYAWNATITPGLTEHWQYVGPTFASNLTASGYNDWSPGYIFDSRNIQLKAWFGGIFTANPPKQLFTKPGTYSFIIQAAFYDLNGSSPSSVRLFLDDTLLRIRGNTWGVLGLDILGRDVYTQIIYGARVSLTIGVVASLIAVTIGLLVGIVAGFYGRGVDQVLMRICDVLLTIPFLPLILVLSVLLASRSSSVFLNLIIALGFFGWPGIARIIRSQVLSVKERTYIEAARAIGADDTHILSKHIIPNVSPLIWVNLALTVPGVIVTEAAVSFLGLGDPSAISWGSILYYAEIGGDPSLWWRFIPPGLCIALISLSFLLIGYSLDQILNPKLRER